MHLGYLRVRELRGVLSSHGFQWSNIFDVWGISILVFISNHYLRAGFEICVLSIQYACLSVNGPLVHNYILLSPGPQKLPEKLFTCQSYKTPEPWTAAEPCQCVCVHNCVWMCVHEYMYIKRQLTYHSIKFFVTWFFSFFSNYYAWRIFDLIERLHGIYLFLKL